MKRWQLYEFGDQPWMRGLLRETYMDCLNLLNRVASPYFGLARPYHDWARRAIPGPVLDLASGGGQHIASLLAGSTAQSLTLPTIVLSDLFPQRRHYERLQRQFGEDRVRHMIGPVSATSVSLQGFPLRSIFNAFHHFEPVRAREVMADALLNGEGIFIAEPLQRSVAHLLLMFAGPPIAMLAPFFSARFELRKLLVCTVIPIVPVMVMADGIVSVLRTYSVKELEVMVPESVRGQVEIRAGRAGYWRLWSSQYFCVIRIPSA